MPGKDRFTRGIDAKAPNNLSTAAIETTAPTLPPPMVSVEPPTSLNLTTALERNATTPTALIVATWVAPPGDVSKYAVQWSKNSSFPANETAGAETGDATTTGATIEHLATGTLYYVRVASIYYGVQSAWSAAVSITTAVDTVAPGPPTSQAASFIGAGDLVVTWVNPTVASSPNFRDVEIAIYSDSSKTTSYGTFNDSSGRFVWTAAQNLAATSNAGDPAVYVELRSRSWGGIFSSAVNTGTVTKAAPSTPSGLTTSWAGDTGSAGADCVISWTADLTVARYVLTIDGVSRNIEAPANRYTYTLDTNRAEHAGTPDPVLSITLASYDAINQANAVSATATATNAAPAAPTIAIQGGAMSLIVCRVTSAKVADFLAYEYVWKRDGVSVRTQESDGAEQQYEAGAAGDENIHDWTCTVRQKDVFGQFSSAVVSATITLDVMTIAYLRSGAFYSDSAGNTFIPPSGGTLAALKDDNKTSGGVTYNP